MTRARLRAGLIGLGAMGRNHARVLADRGVGSAVYYPTPIHRLRPYLTEDGRPGRWDLPETDRAAAEVLSLPIFPSLTPDQLERVAEAANAAVASHG